MGNEETWEVRVTLCCCHMQLLRFSSANSNFTSASITRQTHTLTMNQLLDNINNILSKLSFSKSNEIETCISMASKHHQCAYTRIWSMLMTKANCLAEILRLCRLCYNINLTSLVSPMWIQLWKLAT